VTGKPNVSAGTDWRRARLVLIVAALVPLAVTVLLRRNHVPLGCPSRFVYLYSPVAAYRLAAVPMAILLACVLALGTWLVSRRRWGLALVAIGGVALVVWAYVAPPHYRNQHIFNAESPSQDGAFVREALHVTSVRAYLHDFPQRATAPSAAMRGTRVISNPPGATLVAIGVEQLVRRFPVLRAWALGPLVRELPPTESARALQDSQAVGLVFFWVLTALWAIAAAVLYGVGRWFLPPATAVAYALGCVFTPATLLLTPGKDPAQLLTIAVPLYLWLWAVRRDRVVPAVLVGLALPVVCLASLVHVWLAASVLAATWLSAEQRARCLRRLILPAGAAAVLGTLGLYLLGDINFIATARAVARAQAEVTRGPAAMPLAWQLLGIPLFLLFGGPAWWATTAWTILPRLGLGDGKKRGQARRERSACKPDVGGAEPVPVFSPARDARFGRYLVIATVAVMLATIGFTNLETPRLWIPFTPLLLLGTLLQLTALRRPERRTALLLALLVAIQVTAAALQWSLMDMREAETRLVEQRFFG
jgi:hypothetical protein